MKTKISEVITDNPVLNVKYLKHLKTNTDQLKK